MMDRLANAEVLAVEDRGNADFANSRELQAEFIRPEIYEAYRRAEMMGLVQRRSRQPAIMAKYGVSAGI